MKISQFLREHPSILFPDEMQTVCQPLHSIGIDYFSHVHITADNYLTANGSDPGYFREYFERELHHHGLHTATFEVPQRYVIWEKVLKSCGSEQVYDSVLSFGFYHLFSIVEYGRNGRDCFHFAARRPTPSLNTLYAMHPEYLERFIAHYRRAVILNDRLNRAYSLPLKIRKPDAENRIGAGFHDTPMRDMLADFLQQVEPLSPAYEKVPGLSRRELQCALCMLDGKTSAEIAELLNLSPRTVDVYFERLKARFGSRNKIQLARHLVEAGIAGGHWNAL